MGSAGHPPRLSLSSEKINSFYFIFLSRFTSTETITTRRDGEQMTAALTFTQLLSSVEINDDDVGPNV